MARVVNRVASIDMNEEVKVKLTRVGIKILQQEHADLYTKVVRAGGRFKHFELRLDEEGYYKAPLWYLFHIFGYHISMTSESPFEANEVYVDIK